MYRTKQVGWVIIILVLCMSIGLMLVTYFLEEDEQSARPIIYSTVAVSGLLLLLFYQLETVVDQSEIRLRFGAGLITKTIPLSTIAKTETVRNKFWYGWGLRLTPHGWMWNIAGYEAVEITYKDSGKKFRIGTKDAKILKEEIDKRM